jgi:2-hydroxychromene-2-carboxylate isomerase
MTDGAQPVFFFDLADPHCYLAAEQVLSALPELAEWLPVTGAALAIAPGEPDWPSIAQRADELGLMEFRPPAAWPPDPEPAALACTFAKAGGRTVSFAQALMRQQFAAGRDISELDTVLLAAAAAEIHPTAVIKGISLRATRSALDRTVDRARAAGVRALPAVVWREATFAGPDALALAAAAMAGTR